MSATPILLALDTATDRTHAALLVGDSLRVLDLPGGAQASAQLLPALRGLLHEAGLAWSALDAVAFGSGPGAFTGLRTACAITQGVALGADCPVIVLDTLMAVAEDARQRSPQACAVGTAMWVLQDARMDEMYVGAFTWTGDAWQPMAPPQLWALEEPVRRWQGGDVPNLCGNALRAYPEHFALLMSQNPFWCDPDAVPAGGALATLTRAAWVGGRTVDAALALPRYVRDKVAQTTAERQAIAQAKAQASQTGLDRPMQEADIAAVCLMEQQACQHPSHAWREENYRSSLRAGHRAHVRVDAQTQAPVAVCVTMQGHEEMHLLNIVVAKSWQGRGLATSLLSDVYAQCAAMHANVLWLEVRQSNVAARQRYAKEGFVEVGVRKAYYPTVLGHEDAVVMRRDMVVA